MVSSEAQYLAVFAPKDEVGLAAAAAHFVLLLKSHPHQRANRGSAQEAERHTKRLTPTKFA